MRARSKRTRRTVTEFLQIQSRESLRIFLSEHLHNQPYHGAFADRIGATWCFNPLTPPLNNWRSAKQPNSILLDLKGRTAIWTATHQRPRQPLSQTISIAENS
jgi:hypothetical protein